MLSQAEKEELWHRGEWGRIIENDIGWIKTAVNRRTTLWRGDKEDMYSTAYVFCLMAIGRWDGKRSFCSLWSGCAINAMHKYMRVEARYDRAMAGDWCVGREVVETEPWYYDHLPLVKALSALMAA